MCLTRTCCTWSRWTAIDILPLKNAIERRIGQICVVGNSRRSYQTVVRVEKWFLNTCTFYWRKNIFTQSIGNSIEWVKNVEHPGDLMRSGEKLFNVLTRNQVGWQWRSEAEQIFRLNTKIYGCIELKISKSSKLCRKLIF